MEKVGRRICLISSDSVQNQVFVEHVQEKTGIECVMRRELRRTATSATLADHSTLILVDCQFIAPDTVVQQIEQLPSALTPNVMVAMINVYDHSSIELRAVTRGVRGLFDVNATTEHLLRGISALFQGDVWIPRRVLVNAAFAPHDGEYRRAHNANGAGSLTRREREILTLITTGASNDEIAARLNISSNTVRTHVYNLYRKIDVPNRMQAALWGAENL